MSSLNYGNGLKTFDINGDPDKTISFAPTDAAFVRRVYMGLEKLEACQKKYQTKTVDISEPMQVLDVIDAADKEIRAIIDEIFESRVSETIFGNLSTIGVANGMPIWANFVVSLISECDVYLSTQETDTNPKLKKLLAKYKK